MEGIYQTEDNYVRISCTIPRSQLTTDTKENFINKKALFVLDASGSMGSDWCKVQSAVKYISSGEIKADYIVYNTTAKICQSGEILKTSCGGCTSFAEAFRSVREYLNTEKESNYLDIIFMTDGQDNASKDLVKSKEKFKNSIKNSKKQICLSTIGFGNAHNSKLLIELAEYGHVKGCYRFAESQDLSDKFEEYFDFLSVSTSLKLSLFPSFSSFVYISANYDRSEEAFDFDWFGNLNDLFITNNDQNNNQQQQIENNQITITESNNNENNNNDQQTAKYFDGKNVQRIIITTNEKNSFEIELKPKISDFFFTLRRVDQIEIKTPNDLAYAELLLSTANHTKCDKQLRIKAYEMRTDIQEKFNKYHSLFADIARGNIGENTITSQLNSLRYETKFSKARRARSMDKRIVVNFSKFQKIEERLEELYQRNNHKYEKYKESEEICHISNLSLFEIMKDSTNDILGFPLRIVRPEIAIDAPTVVSIDKILVGTYSFDSFQQSIKFAITKMGSEIALGGFTSNIYEKLNEKVGLFKGPDGEYPNAYLPLYIDDDHFQRVLLQIKPILGYFFTLDPLGFREDQYLGLYSILGEMICKRANGELNTSHFDLLIEDLTKTCRALLKTVRNYIQRPNPMLNNIPRSDLVADFISDPIYRRKDFVPNLFVLIGWNECTKLREGKKEEFDLAFIEELWRRNISSLFHGQSQQEIVYWLEDLLFERDSDDVFALLDNIDQSDDIHHIEDQLNDVHINDNNNNNNNLIDDETRMNMKTEAKKRQNQMQINNENFEEYAKYKLGMLSKEKSKKFQQKFSKGPESLYLIKEDSVYKARELIDFEKNSDRIEQLINNILERIDRQNEVFHGYFEGRTKGNLIDKKQVWVMMIQALQFTKSKTMKTSTENKTYFNSILFAKGEKTVEEISAYYREKYEKSRKEKFSDSITRKNETICAKQIVSCNNIYSIVGRIIKYFPTRGGSIFNVFLSLICSGNQKTIPKLFSILRIIMTGKFDFGNGEKLDIVSNGTPWIHCPIETVSKLKSLVSEELWMEIEISMRGRYGWVYRESDIPNRHGHCNSHPNYSLTSVFSGFRI